MAPNQSIKMPEYLKSRLTYSDVSKMKTRRAGDNYVALDAIPEASFKKYDCDPNWGMSMAEVYVNGTQIKTKMAAVFHLKDKKGKIIKEESYLVDIRQYTKEHADKHNKSVLNALAAVVLGKGDEEVDN